MNIEKSSSALFDFSKAFDVVKLQIFCSKRAALGVSDQLMTSMKYLLAATICLVSIGNALSNQAPASNGVPQVPLLAYSLSSYHDRSLGWSFF